MTAPFQPVVVTAMGGVTAVGDNVAQTCSSIRAGISGFREHDGYWGEALYPEWEPEEPVKVAPVAAVDPMLDGAERLFELSRAAMLDLIDVTGLRRAELETSALLMALPADDETTNNWGLSDDFGEQLGARTGTKPARAGVDRSGHCGTLRAIAQASALLHAGEVERCIVVSVDSYLSYDRLRHLDESWQLRSARNADGFIPGEAAVAVVLQTPRGAERRGDKVCLSIDRLAFAEEPNPFTGELVSSAVGLTGAIRAILPGGEHCDWVLCDLNGQSARAFEWGTACTRLGTPIARLRKLVHPADSVGDVGAASGAVLLACAAAAFERGYAPAKRGLLWTASEGPLRAAALVSSS